MKVQCKVCDVSPKVELNEPEYEGQLICCPSCDKKLAIAEILYSTQKLYWGIFDTENGQVKIIKK